MDAVDESCNKLGKITRGFWPRGGADFSDPGLYSYGVPGIVLDDSDYYPGPERDHPIFAHKLFKIDCAQAKAALKVIREREKNPGKYSALTRQCSTFALEVLKATGNDIDGGLPTRPGKIYNSITGEDLPAGHISTPVKQLSRIGYERASQAAQEVIDQVSNQIDEIGRKF